MNTKVGILGMHGSREEHAKMMHSLGFETVFVRTPKDLEGISGIIFPGGESTSFGRLLQWNGLLDALQEKLRNNLPVFGTCAGAILLSQKGSEFSLKIADLEVNRNAYGRQIDSFSAEISVKNFDEPFPAIFIRAPQFENIGDDLEILAEYHQKPILLKSKTKNILLAAFHPELTNDNRIHQIFAEMMQKNMV